MCSVVSGVDDEAWRVGDCCGSPSTNWISGCCPGNFAPDLVEGFGRLGAGDSTNSMLLPTQ